MTVEQQLKLQAYLDGELPEREAHKVALWLQDDSEALRLLAELKNTRQILTQSEPRVALPDSREFYWSKIARDIEKFELSQKPSPEPVFNWRRLLWPAGLTVGAIAVCFLIVILESPFENQSVAAVSTDAAAPVVEPAQGNSAAITYEDESSGTTLVWFSTDEKPALPETF